MVNYDNFEDLFKALNRDIQVSNENVADQIVKLWKQLVEERFYSYNNIEYHRSFQSLDAISITNIKKHPDGTSEITIEYDLSKIKEFTYIGMRSGLERVGHTDIQNQPMYIEYGFEMFNDEYHEGAHAYDWLVKYIKSPDFTALFENELKKLGYVLK